VTQGNEQGTDDGYVVSPKNGARAPLAKPGQSINPKGSSAKRRMRLALEAALTDDVLSGSFENLARIAQANDSQAALVAIKFMADRVMGPVGPQSAGTVTVRTEVVMLPPTGGEDGRRPMRADVTATNEPRVIRSDDATDE
jgi:hypothetical protein